MSRLGSGPPCRECQGPTHAENKWQLCPTCRLSFCVRCGQPKRESKTTPLCPECRRQDYQRERENHPTDCLDCGKPRDNYCLRCHDCNVERYRLKRKALLVAGPQSCSVCGKLMPVGRINRKCKECARQARLAQPSQKLPCSRCGEYARLKGYSYCRFCNRMVRNMGRLTDHPGLLPRKKTYRRWQKEESV